MKIVKEQGGYLRTNTPGDDKAYSDALKLMEGQEYKNLDRGNVDFSEYDSLYKSRNVKPSK